MLSGPSDLHHNALEYCVGPPSVNTDELPLSDGVLWFCVMVDVALPKPLAQGFPLSCAVHHCQLLSV